jgi:phosphoglycolate phosphatase
MNPVKGGLKGATGLNSGKTQRLAGVLFDKDGTLIAFQETWGPAIHTVMHALAEGDAAKVWAQAESLHFSLEEKRFRLTSPIIAGSSATYGQLWADALGRSDFVELLGEIDAMTALESLKTLTPIGAPEVVFAALAVMGLRLGLATNDSEASARRHIEALGLGSAMDFIVGYDSGHGSKPEPGMILAFARHIGVAPAEIAMVGDTLHDLNCAHAAGAIAVAVLSGVASAEELASRADYVVDDISALPALFADMGGSD